MKLADRIEFFTRLQELNPQPKTELLYNSTFELLIAVMLSAQSTDIGVNKVTRKLFPIANTPDSMAALGLDKIKNNISSLGLYNAKAANVLATCKILAAEHASQVPTLREDLEALPGVGRKTANVVLNTAFGEPTMAVDTHIFRLANRTKLAPGKTVRQVEDKLLKVIPKQFLVNAHHWLILHGRYVCKARKPECTQCVVRDVCGYQLKTMEE